MLCCHDVRAAHRSNQSRSPRRVPPRRRALSDASCPSWLARATRLVIWNGGPSTRSAIRQHQRPKTREDPQFHGIPLCRTAHRPGGRGQFSDSGDHVIEGLHNPLVDSCSPRAGGNRGVTVDETDTPLHEAIPDRRRGATLRSILAAQAGTRRTVNKRTAASDKVELSDRTGRCWRYCFGGLDVSPGRSCYECADRRKRSVRIAGLLADSSNVEDQGSRQHRVL